MKKLPQYFLFRFLGSLYSANLESTFLVLNHFDKYLPNAESSLIENFSNSTFEFDSTFHILFEDIDNHANPASSHMVTIKELGEKLARKPDSDIGSIREIAKKYFHNVDVQFFHLAVLMAVPFRKMWFFKHLRAFLNKVDSILLKYEILGKYGWIMVFTMSKPKK